MLALPVQATTYSATSTTLSSIFAKAVAGDTIKLTGNFGATSLANKNFATAVTIDAWDATFTGTLAITKVTGLKVSGGNFGSSTKLLTQAIRVVSSNQVTIYKPDVVGNGTTGHGIDITGSTHVTVDGGTFTRLRSGVTLSGVTGGLIRNNVSVKAASDGFDIADSHDVKVTGNRCSDTEMTAGAHPDCVQLWSIAGHARQSNIEISDNYATGPTQGFTSFDPDAGGGYQISFLNNRVDTSWSQGIACYGCDYSTIQGNVLTTQLGAKYQTMINVVGGGNNTVSGNTIGAYNGHKAVSNVVGFGVDGADGVEGAPAFDSMEEMFSGFRTPTVMPENDSLEDMFPGYQASIAAVPEPGIWAMLITGFGMAGAALRRRRATAFA